MFTLRSDYDFECWLMICLTEFVRNLNKEVKTNESANECWDEFLCGGGHVMNREQEKRMEGRKWEVKNDEK